MKPARAKAEAEGAIIAPFADWPWSRIKALILSPGVPLTHPAPMRSCWRRGRPAPRSSAMSSCSRARSAVARLS